MKNKTLTRMLELLHKEVQESFYNTDPAHDYEHILRVCRNAELIGRKEGADLEILLTAALLHDLVVYPKGSSKRSKSADESADLAQRILEEKGWPAEKIDQACYCIRLHSYSKNLIPDTLEAKILQDADRLDALGAVGIARTFSVGGLENRKFYNPADPFCEQNRELDDMKWTLDHFSKKLLNLEKTMHTKTGKKLARQRTVFMKSFLAQLRKEIKNNR